MGSNIIELAKLGHERASELKSSCGAVNVRSLAQLISDLATQLEVQLVRGNAQAEQLANAESKCRELAEDNAGLKASIPPLKIINDVTDSWDDVSLAEEVGFNNAISTILKSLPETPATDAFLVEVRASELDSLAGVAETMLVKFSNQQCSSDMHDVVGWKMVLQQATNRAAKLRKGVAL